MSNEMMKYIKTIKKKTLPKLFLSWVTKEKGNEIDLDPNSELLLSDLPLQTFLISARVSISSLLEKAEVRRRRGIVRGESEGSQTGGVQLIWILSSMLGFVVQHGTPWFCSR